MNRAFDCSFEGQFGAKGQGVGDQVITVKGGCHDLRFAGVIDSDKSRRAAVCVGVWSDQSFDKSYNLDLSGLSNKDGSPVTVIIAWAKRDTIKLPANHKELKLMSFLYTIHWYLKYAYVKTIAKWFVKKS